MNTLPALNPVVRVFDNPLCQVGAKLDFLYDYAPTVGSFLCEHIPKDCGRAVLIVNGLPVMQCDWHRQVLATDVIEWHVLAGGKGGSRAILTIIAAIAIAYFTAGLGLSVLQTAALNVALNLAAGLLINALIPIKAADANSTSATPGSVYNTSLASNQARLNQPIPVIYGRMRTYPDFAAQPYATYKDNDQYYSALFCIGQGEYAIEALQIDDTPISNFKGVFYKVLHPGVAPTRVRANVVTSIEVSGNELDANTPIGGFIVCRARQSVTRLEWDLAAEQGLGQADADGNIVNFEVQIQINIRYVDDFGVPTTDWAKLGVSKLRKASRTPQRFTFSTVLATPGRPMIQMVRLTPQNDSNQVLDTITWTGLRGVLSVSAPLCATATYLELVMKASEQLNGITQKKINVIARRKLKVLTSTGRAATATETRGIADAVADILLDTTYGAGRPNAEVDFATLYAKGLTFADRQDRFDILFDSRVTVRDALKTAAQAGRSVVPQRMGVWTMMRDEYQPLPAAAFTTRDIRPGTTSISYAMPTPETPDSISYEYFDNRSWDWVPILCKLPGVVTPVNTITVRVQGITGSWQALREGTYMAAQSLYRRKFPKWQTTKKGLLVAYGSPVIYSPALPNYGSPGDIVNFDRAFLLATLSEEPVWKTGAQHFITLEKINGQLTIAIPVTPGPTPTQVLLSVDPGFDPITTDADRERTKYIFGPEGQHQVIVRLISAGRKGVDESGVPIIELAGVAENNLVHTADNASLPAGGAIQDPVPTTTIDEASGDSSESGITMQSHDMGPIGHAGIYNDSGNGGGFKLQIFKDGTAGYSIYNQGDHYDSSSADVVDTWPGEWASDQLEPGFASQFEIYVTLNTDLDPMYGASTGNFGNWINLASAVELDWKYGVSQTTYSNSADAALSLYYVFAGFRVQMRKVGTVVNLADVTISFNIQFTSVSTGGILQGNGE